MDRGTTTHFAPRLPKLTNETFFRSEIFRQASRDSLEHISQDPAVVEGDCEQVQSPNEVWELPR